MDTGISIFLSAERKWRMKYESHLTVTHPESSPIISSYLVDALLVSLQLLCRVAVVNTQCLQLMHQPSKIQLLFSATQCCKGSTSPLLYVDIVSSWWINNLKDLLNTVQQVTQILNSVWVTAPLWTLNLNVIYHTAAVIKWQVIKYRFHQQPTCSDRWLAAGTLRPNLFLCISYLAALKHNRGELRWVQVSTKGQSIRLTTVFLCGTAAGEQYFDVWAGIKSQGYFFVILLCNNRHRKQRVSDSWESMGACWCREQWWVIWRIKSLCCWYFFILPLTVLCFKLGLSCMIFLNMVTSERGLNEQDKFISKTQSLIAQHLLRYKWPSEMKTVEYNPESWLSGSLSSSVEGFIHFI